MPASPALQWGNVPVPYTALWTHERDNLRPQLRMERWNGQKLTMLCSGIEAPQGKPCFSMLHQERTRRVVREQLCQMCVRPMPADLVGFNQGQRLEGFPLLRDGLPMCPSCALEAFRACPGMARQADAGHLSIWRCYRGHWRTAPTIIRPVPVARGGVAAVNELLLATRQPVFSGPDLQLLQFTRITLDDLEALA